MAFMYEKGILVIPKLMQEALGLKPPVEVSLKLEGRQIIIEPKEDAYSRWKQEFNRAVSDADMSDEQVQRDILRVEAARKKRLQDVP